MSNETAKDETCVNSAPTHCVGVICVRGNDVLIIQRGTPPRKGEWSIPGGRIETGESEPEAALRELFEETGVIATLGPKVATIPALFEDYNYLLHDYAATWVSGEPQAGDDAAQAKFVPLATIPTLDMWPKTEEVIFTAYERLSVQSGKID